MNDPMIPPQIPSSHSNLAVPPIIVPHLGDDPAERQPITGVIEAVEALLRQPRRVLFQLSQKNQAKLIFSLFAIAVFCSLIYGLVVGTFSGGTQLWAAPVKIAVGLLISGFICLPSLYIFSCLVGSQARLAEVCGILAGLLALMTLLLIGFAPVAWVFSQSTESVSGMGALYLVFWLIATHFGLRFLWSGFKHLKAGGSALAVWTVIFILVALQMTTALRPIISTAPTLLPTKKMFFVTHWFDSLDQESKAQREKVAPLN